MSSRDARHHTNTIEWTAEHYEVGLLSNNLPGFIDEMRQSKIIPDVNYAAVIDSSKVSMLKPNPKIYQMAEELASVEPHEIMLVDDTRPSLTALPTMRLANHLV